MQEAQEGVTQEGVKTGRQDTARHATSLALTSLDSLLQTHSFTCCAPAWPRPQRVACTLCCMHPMVRTQPGTRTSRDWQHQVDHASLHLSTCTACIYMYCTTGDSMYVATGDSMYLATGDGMYLAHVKLQLHTHALHSLALHSLALHSLALHSCILYRTRLSLRARL